MRFVLHLEVRVSIAHKAKMSMWLFKKCSTMPNKPKHVKVDRRNTIKQSNSQLHFESQKHHGPLPRKMSTGTKQTSSFSLFPRAHQPTNHPGFSEFIHRDGVIPIHVQTSNLRHKLLRQKLWVATPRNPATLSFRTLLLFHLKISNLQPPYSRKGHQLLTIPNCP